MKKRTIENQIKRNLELHGKPKTRRQFLAYGLQSVLGFSVAPSLVSLLPTSTFAQETADLPLPFITLDLAGGAALPGNFLVGGKGGSEDLLSSYDLLGWNPRQTSIDRRFGAPMGSDVSKVFEGITDALSDAAQANFRMGTILHYSSDDTGSNPVSAIGLVSASGYDGRLIKAGIGTENTSTGGRSTGPLAGLFNPLLCRSSEEFVNNLGWSQRFSEYTQSDKRVLLKALYKMSQVHAARLMANGHSTNVMDRVHDTYGKLMNSDASLMEQLRPENSDETRRNFNLDDRTQNVAATIAYNTISGNAGPGCITLGGYDYHDGGFETGDARDREAGQMIGRLVQLAHDLNRPLFIQILTDGSCVSEKGSRNWDSDSPLQGVTVVAMYDPNGPREMRRTQVGAFTDGQAVDEEFFFAKLATRSSVAEIVLANYLSAAGRLGDISNISSLALSNDQIDETLVF